MRVSNTCAASAEAGYGELMRQNTRGTAITPNRLEWMDSLRGVAIFLVLIWHAASLPSLHGYATPSWIETANDFVLPFRMPTLMFLSGMLVHRSLQKPAGRYYLGKFQGLVWPYLVWGSIYIVQYPSEGDLLTPRAWIATGHLWFIFFITAYYFIAPILENLPVLVFPAACFVISLALPEGVIQMFFYFAVFFFMGNASTRHSETLEVMLRSRLCVGAATFIALCLGVTSAMRGTEHISWFIPANLAGILAVVAAAQQFGSGAVQRIFRYVGRHSIYFYTSHFAVMTCMLLILQTAEATRPAVTFTCLLIVGTSAGFLLSRFRHMGPINWAFRAPNFLFNGLKLSGGRGR